MTRLKLIEENKVSFGSRGWFVHIVRYDLFISRQWIVDTVFPDISFPSYMESKGLPLFFSIYRTDLPSIRGTMKLSRSKGLKLHSVMRRKRSLHYERNSSFRSFSNGR